MDFDTKAKIRLEHWIKHGQDHLSDYQSFARDLRENGKEASADAVAEMALLTEQSLESLNRALAALDN